MRNKYLQILADQPLRRQVIAATCTLLIPFAAIELWSESRTRVERAEEVQAQTASVAATAASYLDQYLNGLDSMASAMLRHPAVMELDSVGADPLFADVLSHHPLLLNIMLIDRDGGLKGSGLPTSDGALTMPFPAEVVTEGKPRISQLMIGQVSHK